MSAAPGAGSIRLEGIGVPGVIGLGLLVFTLAFVVGALAPAWQMRDSLRESEALAMKRKARAIDAPQTEISPDAAIARLRAWLPSQGDARQDVLRLQNIADRHGLQLRSGDYRVQPLLELGVVQHMVVVPVQGRYIELRAFAMDALNDLPSLALDQISLKRESAAATQLDARLQFTLYGAGS